MEFMQRGLLVPNRDYPLHSDPHTYEPCESCGRQISLHSEVVNFDTEIVQTWGEIGNYLANSLSGLVYIVHDAQRCQQIRQSRTVEITYEDAR